MTSDHPQDPWPAPGWGPPPAPAYGYPGWSQPRPTGMATTALVLGIVALVLCWTAVGGLWAASLLDLAFVCSGLAWLSTF